MQNIGIFGGSFDPVHIEHVEIVKTVFNEFNLDKIIVVPAYKPPHKEFLNVSVNHRLNMLKLAFENIENVSIDVFEINSKRTVYTFETLDYMQNKYPNADLKLIIGVDSYNQLNNWRKSEYIAKRCNFIVVNREKIDIDTNSKFFKYSAFSKFTGRISSTIVREYIKKGKNVNSLLDKKVFKYIEKYKLYV